MQTYSSTAFLGNFLCGSPLEACSGNNSSEATKGVISMSENNGRNKKLYGDAIAGIVIGSILAFILIVITLLFLRSKRSRKTSSIDVSPVKIREVEIPLEKLAEEIENGGYNNGYSVEVAALAAIAGNRKREADINGGAKKLVFFGNVGRTFDLEDLLRASAEVLGKGTFGTAYKAVLEIGSVVAVKRLKDAIILEREFSEKIEVVGAMDHENLVPLRAYYIMLMRSFLCMITCQQEVYLHFYMGTKEQEELH